MRALHKWVLSMCCALAPWKLGLPGGREQLRTDHLPAAPASLGHTEGWGLPRKEGAQRVPPHPQLKPLARAGETGSVEAVPREVWEGLTGAAAKA